MKPLHAYIVVSLGESQFCHTQMPASDTSLKSFSLNYSHVACSMEINNNETQKRNDTGQKFILSCPKF